MRVTDAGPSADEVSRAGGYPRALQLPSIRFQLLKYWEQLDLYIKTIVNNFTKTNIAKGHIILNEALARRLAVTISFTCSSK